MDITELTLTEPGRERRSLAPASVGQTPAGVVAGQEALDLGDRFAVADEDEAGGGHGVSVGRRRREPDSVTLRAWG